MFLVHANDTIASYIQVAPQPNQREMDILRGHSHWCLSHVPRSGCFFAHWVLKRLKKPMGIMYTKYTEIYYNVTRAHQNFLVTFLN